jgi:hypothetical protein
VRLVCLHGFATGTSEALDIAGAAAATRRPQPHAPIKTSSRARDRVRLDALVIQKANGPVKGPFR